MEQQKIDQFRNANQELQDFLQRAEGLANGTGEVTEEDLHAIWVRLLHLAPEVSSLSESETAAAVLRDEAAQYVQNLKTLRVALETIRSLMLARLVQLEAAKRHIDGLQGWVNAYQHTT